MDRRDAGEGPRGRGVWTAGGVEAEVPVRAAYSVDGPVAGIFARSGSVSSRGKLEAS